MVKRAELCKLLMDSLEENVRAYAPYRDDYSVAGYSTPKNAQQNRTAIGRQITALRQSLLALEKEVGK